MSPDIRAENSQRGDQSNKGGGLEPEGPGFKSALRYFLAV